MPGLLYGVLFAATMSLFAWFVIPAYTRGVMDLWYPTISDKWLRRWILGQRAWVGLIGVAILMSVGVQAFTGR